MKNKKDYVICHYAEAIVPYLYHEMPESEANVFEGHLAECSSCTDEFAAVADARFYVYEWHKEEFLPLATPRFVVPSGDPERAGILGQLAAIFARPSFAFAGAAAALLVLAFFALSLFRSNGEQIASNTVVPLIGSTPTEVVTTASLPQVETNDDAEVFPSRSGPIRAVRVSAHRRTTVAKAPASVRKITPDDQLRQARRAPTLSNEIEIEDASLRLTDLFEEVGG